MIKALREATVDLGGASRPLERGGKEGLIFHATAAASDAGTRNRRAP
jgi:hypothetical protein